MHDVPVLDRLTLHLGVFDSYSFFTDMLNNPSKYLNGTGPPNITGAIHSVVGELCDETNESIAFPLYDIVSAVGFVIGYVCEPSCWRPYS